MTTENGATRGHGNTMRHRACTTWCHETSEWYEA
jgi:hypothetical protein